MKIGFIGVGNLGEKAVTKLSKDYDLFLSDPIEKDELKKVTNGYFSLEAVSYTHLTLPTSNGV